MKVDNNKKMSKYVSSLSKNRFNPKWLTRAISQPEKINDLCDEREPDSSDIAAPAPKRKYSRPRSVSFHPNVRLYYAATTNNLEEVRILVQSGMADVNAPSPDGATALHCAAFEGHVKCMKVLLENGANLNARDDDGWTPLHAAVCGEHQTTVTLLLTHPDTDFYAVNDDGFTPFQMAVELKNDKLIKLMLMKMSSRHVSAEAIPETNV